MLNKRGYILIYSIGVIALLLLLGATLTNMTIARSKWVSNQAKSIKEMNASKAKVEAASSDLAGYFKDVFTNVNYRYLSELISEGNPIYNELYIVENKYGVEIRDLTKESCQFPNDINKPVCHPVNNNSYTYAFEIVYPKAENYKPGDLVVQKKFFLSMIPSFLYFGLGSNSNMSINGGAYIYGDIFVNNNLYLSSSANYISDSVLYNEPSTFLTVNNSSNLYLQNKLFSCDSGSDCFTFEYLPQRKFKRTDNFIAVDEWLYPTTFVNTPPIKKSFENQFLNVEFDGSYIYYINEAIRFPDETIDDNRSIDLSDITNELNTFYNEGRLEKINSFDQMPLLPTKSIYIDSPDTPIVLDRGLSFPKDKWIIIDGDLTIDIHALDNNLIDANLLITGNITIAGNTKLNSTIYALGKALIHDASINKDISDDNQLMLLTKGSLQISKINEDKNTFDSISKDPISGEINITPDIRGFFYTDKNAKIYTVSSYITIEGGIFTNDSNNESYIESLNDNDNTNDLTPVDYVEDHEAIGLVLNSYRGAVTKNTIDGGYNFIYPTNYLQSRLIIKHSNNIIINQPKGLPLNKKINYISEDVTVK